MNRKMILLLCGFMITSSLYGCGSNKEDVNFSVVTEKIPNTEENKAGENVTENQIDTMEETEEKKAEVAEETEEKTAENEEKSEEVKEVLKVSPLPNTIDINHLDNYKVSISLEEGAAYVDETGAMQMEVTVYTYDLYDMVDISLLKEGDTIEIRGQEVTITSLEQNAYGTLFINGGLDKNGYELFHNESGVWYESGYSDMKSYYELGKVVVPVSPDFEFCDSSDLDKGEITYYAGDLLTDESGITYYFVPHNTDITIEDGMVVKMERRYTP